MESRATFRGLISNVRFWAVYVGYLLISAGLVVGATTAATIMSGAPAYLLMSLPGLAGGAVVYKRDWATAAGLALGAVMVFCLSWLAIAYFFVDFLVTGDPLG